MSVTINYKKSISARSLYNQILFTDEKFNVSTLKKHLLRTEFSLITDLIKTKNLKKKIITFDISSKKKLF